MMKNRNVSLIGAMLLSLSCSSAMAINTSSDKTTKSVEEVQIIGERPLSYYRKQFINMQDSYYGMYNQLVQDRDMKMKCGLEDVQFGSRIKRRICEPVFVGKIEAEERRKALRLAGGYVGALDVLNFPGIGESKARIEESKKEMAQQMFELVQNNPELRETYLAYKNTRDEYLSRKQASEEE